MPIYYSVFSLYRFLPAGAFSAYCVPRNFAATFTCRAGVPRLEAPGAAVCPGELARVGVSSGAQEGHPRPRGQRGQEQVGGLVRHRGQVPGPAVRSLGLTRPPLELETNLREVLQSWLWKLRGRTFVSSSNLRASSHDLWSEKYL